MFHKTQAFYDAIYSFKDYRKEAREVDALIRRHKRSRGRDLLDVACGTGKHLAELKGRYRCRGIDLDAGMLKVARGRLGRVPLRRADMRSFDLGAAFDAVVCLGSSIGYVRTRASLDRAVANFARHAKPGGVVMVEPWILFGKFERVHSRMHVGEADGVHVARGSRSEARGRTSTLHFHYLIASGGKLRSVRERHTLGLFTRGEYERAFRRAGLSCRFYTRGLTGRGLFVGVKPLAPPARRSTRARPAQNR